MRRQLVVPCEMTLATGAARVVSRPPGPTVFGAAGPVTAHRTLRLAGDAAYFVELTPVTCAASPRVRRDGDRSAVRRKTRIACSVAERIDPGGGARRRAPAPLRALVCLPLLLAGCSSLLGIADLAGPADGGSGSDVGVDSGGGGGPGHLTVRGAVHRSGPGMPGVATTVELLRPDGTVVATTMSDSAGAFALPADFTGPSIDVAVHAVGDKITNLLDEYLVFGAPLSADRSAVSLVALSMSEVQALASVSGTNFSPDSSFLYITVEDAAGNPAAGAMLVVDQFVQSVRYLDSGGQPTAALSSTTSNGGIYAFNAKPGVTTFRANGLITTGPRAVTLVADAVFLVELRP
jgi:hypothetical protein